MCRTGLVAPRYVGSSRTRAPTRVPCIGRRILNHCTTREAPLALFLKSCLNHHAEHTGSRSLPEVRLSPSLSSTEPSWWQLKVLRPFYPLVTWILSLDGTRPSQGSVLSLHLSTLAAKPPLSLTSMSCLWLTV